MPLTGKDDNVKGRHDCIVLYCIVVIVVVVAVSVGHGHGTFWKLHWREGKMTDIVIVT